MEKLSFEVRVKKAMDLIMYQSVSKQMAVAICAVSPLDGLKLLDYINSKL